MAGQAPPRRGWFVTDDDADKPPSDDRERIEWLRARLARAKAERPTPPGPGAAVAVWVTAAAIFLLVSVLPRTGPYAYFIGLMVAWVPFVGLMWPEQRESEPGPRPRTWLGAFTLLCFVGWALRWWPHRDRFVIAAVAATVLVAWYAGVARIRLRHWSMSWDGGWAGAVKRWARFRQAPAGVGQWPLIVPAGVAARLWLYLTVVYGLVCALGALITDRPDLVVVGWAMLSVNAFDMVVSPLGRPRPKRRHLWSEMSAPVGGYAGIVVPFLIAVLLGAPFDRHAWWLVAASPAMIALGIAGYVLVTRLPVRRGAVDSI